MDDPIDLTASIRSVSPLLERSRWRRKFWSKPSFQSSAPVSAHYIVRNPKIARSRAKKPIEWVATEFDPEGDGEMLEEGDDLGVVEEGVVEGAFGEGFCPGVEDGEGRGAPGAGPVGAFCGVAVGASGTMGVIGTSVMGAGGACGGTGGVGALKSSVSTATAARGVSTSAPLVA